MDKIKSKPGLLKHWHAQPERVKEYFAHLPALVEGFPLDVALAYVFAQVELAQNMALYCGMAKLHRADSDLAYRAVQKQHLTRAGFLEKYATIYGKELPDSVTNLLATAEAVRDRVMHGKGATDDQKRNAIAHVLAYATAFNKHNLANSCPQVFGSLKGFKGAARSLDKSTTRWMLKGMGFSIA